MASETYNELNKVYEIPVADLVIKPEYQPRNTIDMDKIKELAESIKQKGQRSPIWFSIEKDKPVLIAGHRRYEAIKKVLKQPTIKGILVEGDPQELALIENVVREGLTAIEEAKAYRLLIDTRQYSQKAISNFTGKAESTISETLKIVKKIKPALLAEIEQNNPTCPRWILMKVADETEKKQRALFNRLDRLGITRDDLKKGTTKTPANMPIYMAKATSKTLKEFDYSGLSEKDLGVFKKNLNGLLDTVTLILADLGEIEDPLEKEDGGE